MRKSITHTYWTSEQIEKLKELYLSESSGFAEGWQEILGHDLHSIYNKANALGLYRPKSIQSKAGAKGTRNPKAISHQFRKGHISFNKGKKMSKDMYEKLAPTMFKKSHIPANLRNIGSERVSKEGYIVVKTEGGKWKLKHRLLWISTYGPIPKGMNIQFKNGDRKDIRAENLYLISRSDQLRNNNSVMRYPPELREVIQLSGVLSRRINSQLKDKKENE